MRQSNAVRKYSTLQYSLVIVGLLGYLLPWIVAPSGSMTLNAFDLAEWASLHPTQHGTSPPLLVPILLRLQLVVLSVILGLHARRGKKPGLAAFMIVLLSVAQLPPFEFAQDINNLNYRQQFFLAGASLIAGFTLLNFNARRIATFAIVALPVAGIVSAIHGQSQAEALYRQFQLEAAPGAGMWILTLSYVSMIAIAALNMIPPRRSRS